LDGVAEWLGDRTTPALTALLIGASIGIVASGEMVAALAGPALRLIEGYWPPLLAPVRRILIARIEREVATVGNRYQRLAGRIAEGTASADDRSEYVRLDRRLRRVPSNGAYLPTSIGNTLRAAESRPGDKYGLDAITVWPHLWLLLPAATQAELAAARRSLDSAVAACLWGLLYVLFTPIAWWAAPVGVAVTLIAYLFSLRSRAEVFADLVEAVFDLYRSTLYQQLRWPLPTNPLSEPASGRRLTLYLWRGLDEPDPTFTAPTTK
jgi:hypothetical protein